MKYILLCDAWIPSENDDALVGFDSLEEVESWKREADKICSGTYYIVRIVPE